MLLSAPSALAQNWAVPARIPNTPVFCTGCPSSANNKMTVGYSSPVKTFTGRFLDSQNTRDYQVPFRTARATWVGYSPERNRIYMLIGSAVFAYDADRFFSRLNLAEPLRKTLNGEKYLAYDTYFYAEDAGSGWNLWPMDGQDRLFAMDWDDRGYMYLAYSIFGWGIVKDDPAAVGEAMRSATQQSGTVSPSGPILITKSSTGAYTVFISDTGNARISNRYDVTVPTAPVRKTDFLRGIGGFAKASGGARIAIIDADTGNLLIYTNDQLADNKAPMSVIVPPASGRFVGVDTDGTNFYATCSVNTAISIYSIIPSGEAYSTSVYDTKTSWGQGPTVRYGGGYLTLSGNESTPLRGWNSLLYRVEGGTPTPVSLSNFIGQYYITPPPPAGGTTYVTPASVNSAYINIQDSMVIERGGRYYYIVMAKGLGDVYELEGPDPVPDAVGDLNASGGQSIALSWSAVPNALSYDVYRTSGAGWSKIASVPAVASVTQSYLDVTVAPDTAYLYKVQSVNGSGASGDSLVKLATTMRYTDTSLTGTVIRRVHLTELRYAIDSIRSLAGLAAYSWTDPDLTNASVRAVHVTDLRTALAEALTVLGVTRNLASPVSPGETITSQTLDSLRAATK